MLGPPRFPFPLIKPDVPISGIRLSDWLHRRLTKRRHSADRGAATPPARRRSASSKTRGCPARTPCAASQKMPDPFFDMLVEHLVRLAWAPQSAVLFPASQFLIQPVQ